MGSHNSQLARKLRVGSEWFTVGQRTREKCTIVRHRYNGRVADCYHIMLDSRFDLTSEFEIYNYRRLQNEGLVQVLGAELINTQAPSFCGMEKVLRVLTQPICARLQSLPQLSLEESLYVLTEVLRGFRQIFERLGPVEINDELICITPEGFVKVWVNKHLPQNHPKGSRSMLHIISNEYNIDTVGRSEAQTVRDIFDVVEQHYDDGKFPSIFRNTLAQTTNLGFETAHMLILEYSTSNTIAIADCIDLKDMNKLCYTSQEKLIEPTINSETNLTESSVHTVRPYRKSQLPRTLKSRFIFEGSK